MVILMLHGSSIAWLVFKVLTGTVSSYANKQSTMALYAAEAEYVSLSHDVQETIWFRLEKISTLSITSPAKLASLEKSSSFTALLNL